MNAQLRRTAKACLFSTVAGLSIAPGGTIWAQSAGRVQHADAIEDFAAETPSSAALGRSAPLPSRTNTFGADHKLSRGSSPRPKLRKPSPPQVARTEAAGRSATGATPRPAAAPAEEIEQVAAVQNRTRLQPQPAAAVVAAPQNGESEVQRQLRELYRKNGQEMPDLDLNEYRPPQQASAPFGGAPRGTAARPAPKPSKPNFLERIFHFGRARPKAAPAAAPAPGGRQTAGRNPAAGHSAPRPLQSLPTFRPAPSAPAGSDALAAQRSQSAAMREPAQLAPATIFPDLLSQGSGGAQPRLESQPLIDESTSPDDGESLDLSTDPPEGLRHPAPTAANAHPQGPAASPYSGRILVPHETEQDLARDDDDSTAPTPAEQADAAAALVRPHESVETDSRFALPRTGAVAVDEDDEEDEDWDDLDDDVPTSHSTRPGTVQPSAKGAGTNSAGAGAAKPAAAAATCKSFKGYCPVMLKDDRKLVEARAEFHAEFRGKTYLFSSSAAVRTFEEAPHRYCPAGDGRDVVQLAGGDDKTEGTLEHAAWYRGRLYLFSSPETRRVFVEAPARYSIND